MILYQIFANYSNWSQNEKCSEFIEIWLKFLFQICWSRFWCQKLFLLNICYLLCPNLFQNWKYLEFIKTWNIWYFKYADLNFNVKNNFYEIFTSFLAQSVAKIKNGQKLLKFDKVDISIYRRSQIFQMLSKVIFIKKLKVQRFYWST